MRTCCSEDIHTYMLKIKVPLAVCVESGCKESKCDHSLWRSPMDRTPIVSLIRHDLYQSSNHRGVPSIGLFHKL